MPRATGDTKMCPKCRQRQPLENYVVMHCEVGALEREISLFCETCRTTLATCERCGEAIPIIAFSRQRDKRLICKQCYSALRRRGYAAMLEGHRKSWRRRHGTEMPPGTSWYEQDPDEVLKRPGRLRAERMRAAARGPVDREAIFERDGWVCWLCGGPVAHDEASLDHVVPVAAGGTHEESNLRLAHIMCNSRRQERDPGVIPRRVIEG